MTRQRWRDADGKDLPTGPCPRCGQPGPTGHTYRLEHLRTIGWRLFAEASYVEWYGHQQRFVVMPHADGERAALVPILGGAA